MSRRAFFLVFTFLALLDFFVPFYLLDDVASFQGSFLFWSLLTLMVVIIGTLYIKKTWGG